jgi:DNA-binding transcriptional regulator YbjK
VTVDEHVAKAFASLADVSARELEATAEALTSRRHPLHDFAGVFREVAWSRENDSEPRLARFHVSQYVSQADHDLLEQLEAAEAPFWRHVRDAVLARRKEVEAYRGK